MLSKKLLFTIGAAVAVVSPLLIHFDARAQAVAVHDTAGEPMRFEVASVKPTKLPKTAGEQRARASLNVVPGTLTVRNSNLRDCIQWAYNLKNYQISGPPWLNTEKYDIIAKTEAPVSEEQMRIMFRQLLAERFKLQVQRQKKPIPVYALVVGKQAPKLHPSESDASSVKLSPPGLRFAFHKEPMSQLADTLSTLAFVARPVVDMTGLTGEYDFTLDLTEVAKAQAHQPGVQQASTDTAAESSIGPSIFTVLQEQLGLKLLSRKAPVEILEVAHAERMPEEN